MIYDNSILVDTLPICDSSIVDNIYSLSTDNHYWKCSYISESYQYEDLGFIPKTFYFSDKDFYLFYDFETISTFDIFEDYDFSTFSDYEKLSVVIGFNLLFIVILSFISVIIYKTLCRFVRFIIG